MNNIIHEQVISEFKRITDNITIDNPESTKILEMAISVNEFARTFQAFQVSKNGISTNANFELDYKFSFKNKIKEWFNNSSVGVKRWNKVQFYIYPNGTFEYKTWWDEQFYQDVYGEPSGYEPTK